MDNKTKEFKHFEEWVTINNFKFYHFFDDTYVVNNNIHNVKVTVSEINKFPLDILTSRVTYELKCLELDWRN